MDEHNCTDSSLMAGLISQRKDGLPRPLLFLLLGEMVYMSPLPGTVGSYVNDWEGLSMLVKVKF